MFLIMRAYAFEEEKVRKRFITKLNSAICECIQQFTKIHSAKYDISEVLNRKNEIRKS